LILMKRTYMIIVTTCLLMLLNGIIQPAVASSAKSRIVGFVDSTTNRTYVPIRYISEQLGAQVSWTAAGQIIDIEHGKSTIQLTIGVKEANVDGAAVAIEDVPFLADGVTYVPLRFITDALHIQMEWSKSTSTIYVNVGDTIQKIPLVPLGTNVTGTLPIVSSSKTFTVANRKFNTKMLVVNLLHPRVDLKIGIAGNQIGNVEDLKSMVIANDAAAAINGTFFNAYTEDAFKEPYGYIVKDGEYLNRVSGKRTAIMFDQDNHVEFVNGEDIYKRYQAGDIDGALQVGPRLIVDGKVSIDVEAEGFADPKILTGGGARSAVGVTRDHRMILLTVPGATIPQLAEIMLAAGAYQAMNLDGGASSGLYADGEYLTRTGRLISNALLISVDE
jgi:exopolysaccharide biosynthesis protein